MVNEETFLSIATYDDGTTSDIPYPTIRIANCGLTKLELGQGVKTIDCWMNPLLEELIIPDSVINLICDKHIKGLEPHIGKMNITLY